VCLIVASAATALAAMFPPPMPHWPGTAKPGKTLAPRYVAPATSAPPDYGMIESPPAGAGRSGIIPFSGRQVPLPAGTWQLLVLARGSGPMAVQLELFGRVEAGRLTGLVLAAAPGPLSNAAGAAAALGSCNVHDAILHQAVPPDHNDPLSHECWSLLPLDMDAPASPAKTDEMLRRGLARLHEMGTAVPDRMLALNYIRSDPTGWLTALLLLPDPGLEQPSARHKLEVWVRRFTPLLHKGFDGTLAPSDMTQAVSHDPD
jgi:hypothetical protein